MSLHESGDSTGEASLSGMLKGEIVEGFVRDVGLDEIARLVVRGGWPENIDMAMEDIGVIPESYIEAIVTKDMHERQDRKRSPQKMGMLLRALARNESAKRHLVDPSLSCACLGLDAAKLLNDHETFGLMFEAMVERDFHRSDYVAQSVAV